MGLKAQVANVLAFARVLRGVARVSEVTVSGTGGANVTADHYAPPGVDGAPLPIDYAVTVPLPGAGRAAAVGYADPVSEPKAAAGEMRIYARNAAGLTVCEVWVKGDGSAVTANDLASVTVNPDGTIAIAGPIGSVTLQLDGSLEHWTGAKITALGDMFAPSVPGVPGLGVSLLTHTHPTAAPGAPSAPTPAPAP